MHFEHATIQATVPATSYNLAEHDREQKDFWADSARVSEMRKEQTRKLKAAAESLGVDVSIPALGPMIQSFDGTTPIERFVNEENNF